MNNMTRMGIGSALLLTIVGSLCYLKVPLAQLAQHQTAQAEEDLREVEVVASFNVLFQRRETKARIIEAWAEGRMSLLDAAAQFKMLNAAFPEYWQKKLHERHGGDSEQERACRLVIGYVKYDLPLDDATRADLVTRLETELCHLIYEGALDTPQDGVPAPTGSRE